jgi:hypothetical protein
LYPERTGSDYKLGRNQPGPTGFIRSSFIWA